MFTRRAAVILLLTGTVLLGQVIFISVFAQEKPLLGERAGANKTIDNESDYTLARETPYYASGPQQGRAPDGKFMPGTKVRLLRRSGSYSLVQTAEGNRVYVSTSALQSAREADGKRPIQPGSGGTITPGSDTNSTNLTERRLPFRDGTALNLVKPQLPENVYVVAQGLKVGIILRIEKNNEVLVGIHQEPITSICITGPLAKNLYFLNASGKHIWSATLFPADPAHILNTEMVGPNPKYEDIDYVRCVRTNYGFRPCFSTAYGAKKEGASIKLLTPGGAVGETDVIDITQIGGFWAGDFVFGPDTKTLYLSNGNIKSAGLWVARLFSGPYERIYQEEGPILGFCLIKNPKDNSPISILFTNGTGSIKRLDLATKTAEVVYTSPNNYKFCDIAIGPSTDN
jgi:hypothetical protein